jgi:hypothetical protein
MFCSFPSSGDCESIPKLSQITHFDSQQSIIYGAFFAILGGF